MRLLALGLLSLVIGCEHLPREPYVWRDDVLRPVGVHRADVARAEGRVIEYLMSTGPLVPQEVSCQKSPRAYQVATVETETAYEVRVLNRPGLCQQAPEDTTLPPVGWGVEGPMEFAVSKKDFHIIRVRLAGDDAVERPWTPEPEPERTLAFTTPNASVPVGSCAGPVGVETRNRAGARAPVTKPVTLSLTATPPSAAFFADAKCTTALTSVDLAEGASAAEIYFRGMQVGPLKITASAAGLPEDSQTETVQPARAVAVAFTTAPQTVAKGLCSGAVTVQARDAFDNPATVTAATAVRLAAVPAGSVTFHARADCTGSPIVRSDVPAGSDSATFYFKGRRPQAVTLTAELETGGASQDESIASPSEPPRPGPPKQP